MIVSGLVFISLTAFAEAAVRWSLDCENGFTPSVGGGTVLIQNGSENDPYNTNNDVHIAVDADPNHGKVLRVGQALPDSMLTYLNLDPSVMGPSGKLSVDFKVPYIAPAETRICLLYFYIQRNSMEAPFRTSGLPDW